MDTDEQQRIADLAEPGHWHWVSQRLPALNIDDRSGPEVLPQWLQAVPVRLQPQAQALLRSLSAHHWNIELEAGARLVLRCAEGAWRLQLRQVPSPGIASIERLPVTPPPA
jgi:hypothetical protein